MKDFFETLGDWQPDTGQLHLPPMDKKDIYTEMTSSLPDKHVGPSSFYNIWNTEYPNVKIPPTQRLGKCKPCEDFHKQICATRDPDIRRRIKAQRRKHIEEVISDRRVYHAWRKRCEDNPDKYLCIILDGMDQSKTDLPSFGTGESPQQMTCRVIGALAHSATKDAYAFLVSNFSKETNTMVEVLRRVLDSRESLPPVLVLQFDNTWQENKNSRMFSYLASLVEVGIFEEIIVNFLPVGHTHVRFVDSVMYIYPTFTLVILCVLFLGRYRSTVFRYCARAQESSSPLG